jgi:hypothetical protein
MFAYGLFLRWQNFSESANLFHEYPFWAEHEERPGGGNPLRSRPYNEEAGGEPFISGPHIC